eukprot:TRINITY_DN3145_c0_g2_i1.p1 TRINITY_DN3145_c0_g2~~TRINITY_DN3145_c0_g2_i1.p1  ORF type:complete len:401 (+),score=70.02 TRINITY_DN3145_c0_g2_i1:66-1205(+)
MAPQERAEPSPPHGAAPPAPASAAGSPLPLAPRPPPPRGGKRSTRGRRRARQPWQPSADAAAAAYASPAAPHHPAPPPQSPTATGQLPRAATAPSSAVAPLPLREALAKAAERAAALGSSNGGRQWAPLSRDGRSPREQRILQEHRRLLRKMGQQVRDGPRPEVPMEKLRERLARDEDQLDPANPGSPPTSPRGPLRLPHVKPGSPNLVALSTAQSRTYQLGADNARRNLGYDAARAGVSPEPGATSPRREKPMASVMAAANQWRRKAETGAASHTHRPPGGPLPPWRRKKHTPRPEAATQEPPNAGTTPQGRAVHSEPFCTQSCAVPQALFEGKEGYRPLLKLGGPAGRPAPPPRSPTAHAGGDPGPAWVRGVLASTR